MPRKKAKGRHGGRRPGAGRPKKERVVAAAPLVEAVKGARTAKKLGALARQLAADILEGKVDRLLAEAALAALKEARQNLRAAREERTRAKINAIAVLTPGELAALEVYRASIAPKPVEPGAPVPPPVIVPVDPGSTAAPIAPATIITS